MGCWRLREIEKPRESPSIVDGSPHRLKADRRLPPPPTQTPAAPRQTASPAAPLAGPLALAAARGALLAGRRFCDTAFGVLGRQRAARGATAVDPPHL